MSRSPLPLMIEDVSAFAKDLRTNWPETEPSHAQTLALVAKAAGYRNHQHLKASVETHDSSSAPGADRRVKDALRVFDESGVMQRWPKKTSVQALCLAWFWSRLPSRTDLSETAVNEILSQPLGFEDYVLLRRSLIDHKMANRTTDGKTYRRIERQPSLEERQVIRALSERVLMTKVNLENKGQRPAFGEPI